MYMYASSSLLNTVETVHLSISNSLQLLSNFHQQLTQKILSSLIGVEQFFMFNVMPIENLGTDQLLPKISLMCQLT